MKRGICILVFLICWMSMVMAFYDQQIEEEEFELNVETVAGYQVGKPKIQASAAILYDRNCHRILYGKNEDKEVQNASTTKIMTAIVAYENSNIEDFVLVSKKAAHTGGSTIRLREGDRLTLDSLIKGLLICSGNDAAVAIAEYVAGDVESFCDLMNEKAIEIGAINSHFVTPHGLDKENHYSSAYDLAIMADYILDIPYLAEIIASRSVTIKVNDYERVLSTTNEMLSFYPGADGVKTGYTGGAGRCLVASATQNDWQLISVVLGCGTKKQRTLETTQLLNYGFQTYKMLDLCENMPKEFTILVEKSIKGNYFIPIEIECRYPIQEEELSKVHLEYSFANNLVAPIMENQVIGEIKIFLGDKIIEKIEIKSNIKIQRKTIGQYIESLFRNMHSNITIQM